MIFTCSSAAPTSGAFTAAGGGVERPRPEEGAWTATAARGRRADGASFCFSSSRWIVIAFSGFFTSCATPADSRPSATSFRE